MPFTAPQFDLTTLAPADGFVIQGDLAGDQAGYSVSDAGDINGDGYADIIVGAKHGDDGGANAGEAYVIFGRATGFGTIDGTGRNVLDLTALAASDGFIIQGDVAGDYAGMSVSSAGDVNGDGFADLIVGARGGDDGGFPRAGEAYVIFGKAGGFSTIDLTTFNPANPSHDPSAGFIIQGSDSYDETGWSVSSAGDVNGDGFDDLLVGAPKDETGGTYGGSRAGAAYVIFGKANGFGTIDLQSFAPSDSAGFAILGDDNFDEAGFSVSLAGDVNGDGYGDLIVGAPGSEDGAPAGGGAAYVIFGKASGFADIDLTTFDPADPNHDPADGFQILGAAGFDQFGTSVSSAGDFNGDGYDDLIVASPEVTNNANDGRTAYVIYGKAGGWTTVDVAAFTAAEGFAISNKLGQIAQVIRSVSGAGDVNGDGFDDVIVGIPSASNGPDSADGGVGKAYVIYGNNAGIADVDLDNFTPDQGFVIIGDTAGDGVGFSVSAAGDVNNDGFDDLIVGAPEGDDGGSRAGEAYVVFGKAPTTAVTRVGSDIGQTIRGGDFGDSLSGLGGDDTLIGAGGNDDLDGGIGDDQLFGDAGADSLTGGGGSDALYGGADDDTLRGQTANDTLDGEAGNDTLYGGGGNDSLFGGDGDDLLQGNGGDDAMSGGAGNDIYFVNSAGDTVTELLGEGTDEVRVAGIDYTLGNNVENLRILSGPVSGTGNGLANEINGSNGNNTISGLGNNDTLRGRGGSDTIDGGDGNDVIAGNAGQDFMTGGTGADRFVFTAITDSAAGAVNADVVLDFSHAQGDRIQLNAIDAIPGGADNPFAFIGTAAFSSTAGQLRYRFEAGTGDTLVELDVDGDGVRDMSIRLTGHHDLVAGDFIL